MLDYCWLVVVSTAPIPRARVIPPSSPAPPTPSTLHPLPRPLFAQCTAVKRRAGRPAGRTTHSEAIVCSLTFFSSRFILKILNKNLNVKVNFHWYIGKVVDLLWDWSPGCHNLLLGCPDTAVCPKVQMEANFRPNGKNYVVYIFYILDEWAWITR